MDVISVKLLGTPSVKLNGKLISFPYKKSEALFYYVIINKKVSRDEAINVFWSESGEETGRKNLRDALYKIKTSTSENIFSNSKSIIEFYQRYFLYSLAAGDYHKVDCMKSEGTLYKYAKERYI